MPEKLGGHYPITIVNRVTGEIITCNSANDIPKGIRFSVIETNATYTVEN